MKTLFINIFCLILMGIGLAEAEAEESNTWRPPSPIAVLKKAQEDTTKKMQSYGLDPSDEKDQQIYRASKGDPKKLAEILEVMSNPSAHYQVNKNEQISPYVGDGDETTKRKNRYKTALASTEAPIAHYGYTGSDGTTGDARADSVTNQSTEVATSIVPSTPFEDPRAYCSSPVNKTYELRNACYAHRMAQQSSDPTQKQIWQNKRDAWKLKDELKTNPGNTGNPGKEIDVGKLRAANQKFCTEGNADYQGCEGFTRRDRIPAAADPSKLKPGECRVLAADSGTVMTVTPNGCSTPVKICAFPVQCHESTGVQHQTLFCNALASDATASCPSPKKCQESSDSGFSTIPAPLITSATDLKFDIPATSPAAPNPPPPPAPEPGAVTATPGESPPAPE